MVLIDGDQLVWGAWKACQFCVQENIDTLPWISYYWITFERIFSSLYHKVQNNFIKLNRTIRISNIVINQISLRELTYIIVVWLVRSTKLLPSLQLLQKSKRINITPTKSMQGPVTPSALARDLKRNAHRSVLATLSDDWFHSLASVGCICEYQFIVFCSANSVELLNLQIIDAAVSYVLLLVFPNYASYQVSENNFINSKCN